MTGEADNLRKLDLEYTRLRVPFGPIHPALKEPVSLRVTVQKEEIFDVEMRLGHVHRGIEALAEKRNLIQTLYLVERICGICSHSHTTCFSQTIEEIGEIKPPERALYLRTLIFELERIHSHLLLLGLVAYEVGFDTLFMFIWHVRESILDLCEEITGNRVHHSMNTLGGVRWDLTSPQIEKLQKEMKKLEKSTKHIAEVFKDKTIEQRLSGVGILARDKAKELCAVGPIARGSGVTMDIRRDHPYAAYEMLKDDFSVISKDAADAYSRTEVRILELFESINLILKILDQLPNGPIALKENALRIMRKIPEAETISVVEAPRGELFYFAKTNGKEGLHRLKIRTPTLANLLALKPMLVGNEIADVPVIVASIDPCFSCTDRMVIVDQNIKETRTIEMEKLRYGRRKN